MFIGSLSLVIAFFLGATAKESLPSIVLNVCEILPKNSIILAPNSCTNWIKCPSTSDGNDFEQGSCLPGLYFNKNTKKCEPKNHVQCPFETASKDTWNDLCRDKPDGTFLAHPNSCNGFIYCKNFVAKPSQCPSNLVFHPQLLTCVYKEQYECDNIKEANIASNHNKSEECLLISDAIYFADRTSCNVYHKCHSGIMMNFKCKEDMVFDFINGQCLPRNQSSCFIEMDNKNPLAKICGTVHNAIIGYVPDGKTCSGYYYCANITDSVDRNPIWNKCSDGRFFDVETLSCRDRISVKCYHDRCEGMGDKFVNVIGDCQRYASCKNNVKVNEGKCSHDAYFDEKSQGCIRHKIQYPACSL